MAESKPIQKTEQASPFDSSGSAGLFVGVSSFEDERIDSVPFAVDDAIDLAYLFALELKLILPERIVLLLAGAPRKPESAERLAQLSENGTRHMLARAVDVYRFAGRLARSTDKNGIFVVAMATHGVSDQGGDYLITTDSLKERLLRTGVAVAELFDEVSRSSAERRLVFIDACRERLSKGTRGDSDSSMKPSFAHAIAEAKGSVILSAANLGGFAYDDTRRGNGVFTAAILDGLHGEAPAEPSGWITVRTLADFVQERVSNWVYINRPDHSLKSLGISRQIEATAESVPLALHPKSKGETSKLELLEIAQATPVVVQTGPPPEGNWKAITVEIIERSLKTLLLTERAKERLGNLRLGIPAADLSPSGVALELEAIFEAEDRNLATGLTVNRIEYTLGIKILSFCSHECVPLNLALIDFYTNAADRSERWVNEFFDRHVSSFGEMRWKSMRTAPDLIVRRMEKFFSSKIHLLIEDWKAESLRVLVKELISKLEPFVSSAAASFYDALSESEEGDLSAALNSRRMPKLSSSAAADWIETRVTIPWLNLFGASYLRAAQLGFINVEATPRNKLRTILVKEILANGERQELSIYRDLARYLRTGFIGTTAQSFQSLEDQRAALAKAEKELLKLQQMRAEINDLLRPS